MSHEVQRGCPVDHAASSQQKTARVVEPAEPRAVEDLRIEKKPSVSWNDLTTGYELRGFTIAVG